MLKTRPLERIVKGVANHRRIGILEKLNGHPGMTVGELSEAFGIDIRTCSVHLKKMTDAGVIIKRSAGREVQHELTPLGGKLLTFLKSINPHKR